MIIIMINNNNNNLSQTTRPSDGHQKGEPAIPENQREKIKKSEKEE